MGADNQPSEDELQVLRLWKQGLVAQDPRYERKGLLKLAALAMTDADFRSRLISDTQSILSELPPELSLPEGVELRFYENTNDTLHIVLPDLGAGLARRPAAFPELLRSRT